MATVSGTGAGDGNGRPAVPRTTCTAVTGYASDGADGRGRGGLTTRDGGPTRNAGPPTPLTATCPATTASRRGRLGVPTSSTATAGRTVTAAISTRVVTVATARATTTRRVGRGRRPSPTRPLSRRQGARGVGAATRPRRDATPTSATCPPASTCSRV